MEQEENDRRLEILKHQAMELRRKNHTTLEQVRYIFRRPLLYIIIINYSLCSGLLTACGSISAEVYVRYGRSEVISLNL